MSCSPDVRRGDDSPQFAQTMEMDDSGDDDGHGYDKDEQLEDEYCDDGEDEGPRNRAASCSPDIMQ